ncbi:10444_t:CDS:2, partial [Cetraspora pellucida]
MFVFSPGSLVLRRSFVRGFIFRKGLRSTTTLPSPNKEVTNARITSIVDQISSLTVIETSELVQSLKTRLNIQDVALPTVSNVANVAVPASEATAPVEEAKAPEKTAFTVKLEKYNADAKTKIIREMKNILPGTNLVE